MTPDDVPSNEEFVNFALFAECDPMTYEDACVDSHWIEAIDKKIHAIEKNDTFQKVKKRLKSNGFTRQNTSQTERWIASRQD